MGVEFCPLSSGDSSGLDAVATNVFLLSVFLSPGMSYPVKDQVRSYSINFECEKQLTPSTHRKGDKEAPTIFYGVHAIERLENKTAQIKLRY